MAKKVYKLKKSFKYKIPKGKAAKSYHNFRMYINKRNFQQNYGFKYTKFGKKFKKVGVLLPLSFYCAVIFVILLLKCFGF
jgi:hypothetical protein